MFVKLCVYEVFRFLKLFKHFKYSLFVFLIDTIQTDCAKGLLNEGKKVRKGVVPVNQPFKTL